MKVYINVIQKIKSLATIKKNSDFSNKELNMTVKLNNNNEKKV